MRQSKVFQQKTVDEHANVGYIMPLSLSIYIYILYKCIQHSVHFLAVGQRARVWVHILNAQKQRG